MVVLGCSRRYLASLFIFVILLVVGLDMSRQISFVANCMSNWSKDK